MNFVKEMKSLAMNRGKCSVSGGILEDVIRAVLGDKISFAKVVAALMTLPERMFWAKMEMFLKGVYPSEEDCGRLCAKFDKMGKKEENAFRLVEIINRVESKQKIRYLIRATHCLMDGSIDCPVYFRICHVIMYALDEDLAFLKEYIREKDLLYSSYVQGLLTAGLMHQSVIGSDGVQKYSFVPLAWEVYYYAVGDSAEMNCGFEQLSQIPRVQVEFEMATIEDIDKLFGGG